MPWREHKAVIVEFDGRSALLQLRSGEQREIVVPDQIHAAVGMTVRMIDTGDEVPIVLWGS